MKSLHEFLGESESMNSVAGVALPPDGMHMLVSRKHLPQIRDHAAFTKDLTEAGIATRQEDRDPKSLYPTQSEFDQNKVDSLKAHISSNDGYSKPINVSNDGYILDGHHRWLAHLQSEQNVPTNVIDKPYKELYEFLDDKPYVEKVGLKESSFTVNGDEQLNGDDHDTMLEGELFEGELTEDELAESILATVNAHPGKTVHALKRQGGYLVWHGSHDNHDAWHVKKHWISAPDFKHKYTETGGEHPKRSFNK